MNHLISAFLWRVLLVVILLFTSSGCDQEPDNQRVAPIKKLLTTELPKDQNNNPKIDKLVKALHEAAIQSAINLKSQLSAWLSGQDESSLQQARKAWFECHQRITELWVLYQLDPAYQSLYKIRGLYSAKSMIDSTPLTPGYLDSVPGYPGSGLIYAQDIKIDRDSLLEKHQFADELFVIFGLHPIEYYLWILSDKIKSEDNQLIRNRRQELIQLIGAELVEQLKLLHQRWTEENLSTAFQSARNENSLLTAAILYIDRSLLEQLLLDESGTPEFWKHSSYHKNHSLYWNAVLSAIDQLLVAASVRKANEYESTKSSLLACLKNYSSPVTLTFSSASDFNTELSKSCLKETRELKERIILMFNAAR